MVNVIMLSVVMVNVIMLSVVMVNVKMLSVMAPVYSAASAYQLGFGKYIYI
jgi:hypothetical protein